MCRGIQGALLEGEEKSEEIQARKWRPLNADGNIMAEKKGEWGSYSQE
jgi:hypothetical protein